MDDQKTNQDNYKTRQRFDINIKDIYSSYIKPNKSNQKGIDDYRSKKSIQGKSKSVIVDAIKKNSFRGILKKEDVYQESRCHAFYRMIGFPVYDNTDYYNPGFDNSYTDVEGKNKNIQLEDKIRIATTSIQSKFTTLCDARENMQLDFYKCFNFNESVNASVLALSSLNTRQFVSSLDKITDPSSTVSNMDPLKHSYHIETIGQVGNYKPYLLEYIGTNGDTPNVSKLPSFDRYHIIYPFLVDARYSESVNVDIMPAVPFALYDWNFKPSSTVTVEIPMLETIITHRLSLNNSVSGQLQEIKDYIQNNPSITDNTLISTILTDYQLTEQQEFIHYLYIMESMINELIKAQTIARTIQKTYYWLPVPSKTGPENGVTTRPIIISQELSNNPKFVTQFDSDLINASILKFIDQTTSKTSTDAVRHPIFPYSSIIFNTQNNNSCGDLTDDNVKHLSEQRNEEMLQAGEALQIIEMIMGEFSGLGLCDILAIVASLHIMPKDKLLGFLDKDAFARMKYKLKQPDAVQSSLLDSIVELTNTVKNFYNLMDKLYLDIYQNNSGT
jgi:hypothetical protein